MTEPPPPDLAELFVDEAVAPPILDQASRAAVRTKLATTVGTAPLGAVGSLLGATGKIIAVLALAVGVGTWYKTHGDREAARHAPIVDTAPATEQTSAIPPVATTLRVEPDRPTMSAPVDIEAADAAPNPKVRRRARVRPSHEVAPAADADAEPVVTKALAAQPSQALLLRDAWASPAAGDGEHALELARRDRELHPEGELTEERDALEVQALAKTGHSDEARAAATRFLASYPDSIHRARVERAIKQLAARHIPMESP